MATKSSVVTVPRKSRDKSWPKLDMKIVTFSGSTPIAKVEIFIIDGLNFAANLRAYQVGNGQRFNLNQEVLYY